MRKLEISRYEIQELIGQNKMSVVYRALDTDLQRKVAVKVLHDFLATQADARRRFQREAVAVAQLKHRGIVEIFDYSGSESEETYIVTELIERPTLRSYVDNLGQIKHPEVAALLTLKLSEALAHAHEHGVIHRDLKPENIMVSPEGELKLMDFGIAQISGGPRLTLTGTLLGSPAHMAPEIIDGQRSDERADIFSLGTILYWLATGKLPFEANNPSALFKRILSGEYDDPQMVEPKIGNGLAKIIRKTLEPDREARYSNVYGLIDAIKEDLLPLQLELPEVVTREFLNHPIAYNEKLSTDLIPKLTELGQEAVKTKNLGHAMDCFNRVLALEPQNQEVHYAMKRILRQRGWSKRLKKVALAAGVASVAIGGGLGLSQLNLSSDTPTPASAKVSSPKATKSPSSEKKFRVEIPAKLARSNTPPAERKPLRKSPRVTKAITPKPVSKVALNPQKKDGNKITDTTPPRPEASLELKIGNSFADVYLNGSLVHKDFMRGTINLEAGKHKLRVVKPGIGAYKARTIRVQKDGKVFEIKPSGEERPILGAMLFPIPKHRDPNPPSSWIAAEP